jgi:hypothetical protein
MSLHNTDIPLKNPTCPITYSIFFVQAENVNVRDFISAHKKEIVFFNSIHSYGQLILLPWGYTRDLG